MVEHKFSRGKEEYRVLIPFTTGLNHMPYPGSVGDQPERLLTFFEQFLSGDDHAFHQLMNRKA